MSDAESEQTSDVVDDPKPSDVVDSVPIEDADAGADGVEGEVVDDRPWYLKSLRSTSPNPSIDEVDGADDLLDNWQSYLIRGLEKAAGVDDAEAWVDLARGSIGGLFEYFDRSNGDQDAQPDAGADDTGGEDPIL